MTAIADARAEDSTEIMELLRRCELPLGVEENLLGFVVVRSAEKLVGCCGIEVYGGDGLLRSLAVDAVCRKRGLGTQLVEATLEHAKAQGLGDVYLLTETAAAFFSRFGFERCARADASSTIRQASEFSTDCCSKATLMRRSLVTSSPFR